LHETIKGIWPNIWQVDDKVGWGRTRYYTIS
jgi:hypothetical protein